MSRNLSNYGRYVRVQSRTPLPDNSKLNGSIEFTFSTANDSIICKNCFIEVECSLKKRVAANGAYIPLNSGVYSPNTGAFIDGAMIAFLNNTTMSPIFTSASHTINSVNISTQTNYNYVAQLHNLLEKPPANNNTYEDRYVSKSELGKMLVSGNLSNPVAFCLGGVGAQETGQYMNTSEMALKCFKSHAGCRSIQRQKYYHKMDFFGLFTNKNNIIPPNCSSQINLYVDSNYLTNCISGGVCVGNTGGVITDPLPNVSPNDFVLGTDIGIVFKIHSISLWMYYETNYIAMPETPLRWYYNQKYCNIIALREGSSDESISLSAPAGSTRGFFSVFDNRSSSQNIFALFGGTANPVGQAALYYTLANPKSLSEIIITYRNIQYPYMNYDLSLIDPNESKPDNLRAYLEFALNAFGYIPHITFDDWMLNPIFCFNFDNINNNTSTDMYVRLKSSVGFSHCSLLVVLDYNKVVEYDYKNGVVEDITPKTVF